MSGTTMFAEQLRHMCRHPRCRSKLPAPVENKRNRHEMLLVGVRGDIPAPYIESPPIVVERDDGMFQIGLEDETSHGPFPSRQFAESVRGQEAAKAERKTT